MFKIKHFIVVSLCLSVFLQLSAKEDKTTYGRFTASYTHMRYDMDFNLTLLNSLKLTATDKAHGVSIDAIAGKIFNRNSPFSEK